MKPLVNEGDKVRSSWSEDVRIANGNRVYVSTAVEIAVQPEETLAGSIRRLRAAMAAAHMRNIETAKGGSSNE